jgi:hypothetical protein
MRDVRKREVPARAARRPLDRSIGYALGRAFRRMNRAVSTAVRSHGLSAVQGNILLPLWAEGPMTIGLIAAEDAFLADLTRAERAQLLALLRKLGGE